MEDVAADVELGPRRARGRLRQWQRTRGRVRAIPILREVKDRKWEDKRTMKRPREAFKCYYRVHNTTGSRSHEQRGGYGQLEIQCIRSLI